MRKTILTLTAVVLLAGAVAIAVGCGSSPLKSGDAVPANAEAVGIKSINAAAGSYAGKKVVVSGYYGIGLCSDCFLIKDGAATLRVEGSETVPVPPKSYLNKPLKVYGTIVVREGTVPDEQTVTLEADGLEFQ